MKSSSHLKNTGYHFVVGIDEVGRGPVAGPVSVCGFVVMGEGKLRKISMGNHIEISRSKIEHLIFPDGLVCDSKKLSKKKRGDISEKLHLLKKENRVFFHIAERTAKEIDERGISLCLRECVTEILEHIEKSVFTDKEHMHILLDGALHAPTTYIYQETIVKGDEKIAEIAMASIIAKVYRDAYMEKQSFIYKDYGFDHNAGYLTKKHSKAIEKYGICPLHRKSFLKNIIINNGK